MKALILFLAMSAAVTFAGCSHTTVRVTNQNEPVEAESSSLKTYENEVFSVQYPAAYSVEERKGIVTISNTKGKIVVGADFDPSVGPAPEPGMTEAVLDTFPKDTVFHGYDAKTASALFYKTGDEETMKELKKIQESIKLK